MMCLAVVFLLSILMSLVFHFFCEIYIGMWVVIGSNYVHERTGVQVEIFF